MPPDSVERSTLMPGLLVWAGFSVLLVALRGVRWDENFEFAQVMLGQIVYPDWHPLRQYTSGFFSFQPWSLAALMSFSPGPLLANGLRNILMLWATVLPTFVLAYAVSRRMMVGHVAVLLTLAGIHTQFFSNYPVQIWPYIYSNGHVGQGWALMTLALWMMGRHRAGWLLFGFMPGIHLGQFPPLAVCGAVLMFCMFYRGEYAALKLALGYVLPGLIASALLFLYVGTGSPAAIGTAPPLPTTEPSAVLHTYLEHFASHRALPGWTGFMPLALLMAVLLSIGKPLRRYPALTIYAGALTLMAVGIALLHWTLGAETPEILLRWMPYRILNHAAPLLIATSAGLLAGTRGGTLFLTMLLSLLVARPVASMFLPEDWYARYLAGGELWLFLIAGAAMLVGVSRDTFSVRAMFLVICASILLLILGHQLGAAGLIVGASVFRVFSGWNPFPKFHPWCLVLSSVLLVALITVYELKNRSHLSASEFEREAQVYLAEHNPIGAPVLVPWQQESLQAKLHQPVMADMATVTWVPYKPEIAPRIWTMYREIYGVDIAPGLAVPLQPMAWHELWTARSRGEWERLSERYRFVYVIAPSDMMLPLERVLNRDGSALFRIHEKAGE